MKQTEREWYQSHCLNVTIYISENLQFHKQNLKLGNS